MHNFIPRLIFLRIKNNIILIPDFYMYIFNSDIKNNEIKISWIEDNIKKTYILYIQDNNVRKILSYPIFDPNKLTTGLKYYYFIKDFNIFDCKYINEYATDLDKIEYIQNLKKIKMKYYLIKNILYNNEYNIIQNMSNIIDYIKY